MPYMPGLRALSFPPCLSISSFSFLPLPISLSLPGLISFSLYRHHQTVDEERILSMGGGTLSNFGKPIKKEVTWQKFC